MYSLIIYSLYPAHVFLCVILSSCIPNYIRSLTSLLLCLLTDHNGQESSLVLYGKLLTLVYPVTSIKHLHAHIHNLEMLFYT